MYTKSWARAIAKKYNCMATEMTDNIIEGLNNTDGQCPCVPSYARTMDTLCPCKNFRDNDDCLCGMFLKKNV